MKKIFILNGAATSGKDTFCELLNNHIPTLHYSYVENTKQAAREYFGWDGGKTENDRKFLAELNTLAEKYNDTPFKDVSQLVSDFINEDYYKVLIIDAREPQAVERMKKEFNAKTIFVSRNGVNAISSNHADKQVNNDYTYDIYICNDGDLEALNKEAIRLAEYIQTVKIQGN